MAFSRCSRNSRVVSSISLVGQLANRELAGALDGHEQAQLAFCGFHLGGVHVEEADGVALEALTFRLAALDVRQTGDAVLQRASVQR